MSVLGSLVAFTTADGNVMGQTALISGVLAAFCLLSCIVRHGHRASSPRRERAPCSTGRWRDCWCFHSFRCCGNEWDPARRRSAACTVGSLVLVVDVRDDKLRGEPLLLQQPDQSLSGFGISTGLDNLVIRAPHDCCDNFSDLPRCVCDTRRASGGETLEYTEFRLVPTR